jgi:hypothetical protein
LVVVGLGKLVNHKQSDVIGLRPRFERPITSAIPPPSIVQAFPARFVAGWPGLERVVQLDGVVTGIAAGLVGVAAGVDRRGVVITSPPSSTPSTAGTRPFGPMMRVCGSVR